MKYARFVTGKMIMSSLDYRGGANEESLKEARINFKKFKASSPKFLNFVRPPNPEEIP